MPIVLKEEFKVVMDRQLLEALLEGARRLHPREILLLLRGRKEEGGVEITEFLFPPSPPGGRISPLSPSKPSPSIPPSWAPPIPTPPGTFPPPPPTSTAFSAR